MRNAAWAATRSIRYDGSTQINRRPLNMSTQLLEPIRSLRSSLRRLAIARGLGLVIAAMLGLVVLVGVIDWFLHINDGGTRLLLGLSICVAVGFVAWRWIFQPGIRGLSELQVAQRIEAIYPEVHGRLSSSVEFISQPPPGSSELTQTTVDHATATIDRLNVDEMPDRWPMRLALGAAAFSALIAASLFLLRPVESQIAVGRLLSPFQDIPWPRKTDFRVIDDAGETLPADVPLTMVRGDFFEVLVENTRGELPTDAVIEYRLTRSGRPGIRPLHPVTLETETAGEVGRAVLSPSKSPVYFRAIGGDHKSPWYRMNVVAPPEPKSVQVTITHPQYTGKGDQKLPRGATSIEALVGSKVRVEARGSDKLKSAAVNVFGRSVPAQLKDDSTRMVAELDLNEEGVSSWWIEMTGVDGIEDPRPTRYELRVAKDSPPSVFIEVPLSDIRVTPLATVPVRVIVTDDQGIEDFSLAGYFETTESEPFDVPLTRDGDETALTGVAELNLLDRGVAVGTKIILQATARDRFDGEPDHVVQSETRTLSVVDIGTKRAELARSQADLLDELQRVLVSQTKARDSVTDLLIQQREAGQLRRTDLDLLKRTEIDQHRIASTLFDESDGLRARIQRLVEQFVANQVDATESRNQLSNVVTELDYIHGTVMPPLQSELTGVRKEVENALNSGDAESAATLLDAEPELKSIETYQNDAIDSLASVLAGAESWKRRVDLHSELARLISQQDEIAREAGALGERSLTSDSENNPQQVADAARLSKRQERLAVGLDELLGEVSAAAEELLKSDPAASARLRAGRAFAEQNTPSVKMREAAAELQARRMGAASTLQAAAIADLRELDQIFDGPAATSYETQEKNLAESEARLSELVQQQDSVAAEIGKVTSEASAAAQAEVRNQAEREQRKLARSSSRGSADETASAVQKMAAAEQSLADGNTDEARANAQAAAADLREALQSARQRREQLQRRAEQERLFARVGELKQVVKQQKEILTRTREFEELLLESGRRTRKQSREVLHLGEQQGELVALVQETAKVLESSAEIVLVLESAAGHMLFSEARLLKRDTTAPTTEAQRAAIASLNDVIAAVEPNQEQGDAEPPPEGEDVTATPQPAEDTGLISLESRLRLVRSLQVAVNERTIRLRGEDAGELETKAMPLASQQLRLASLAADLLDELASEAAPDDQENAPPSQAEQVLKSVVDNMQQAAVAIKNQRITDETTTQQTRAVTLLDRLIEAAKGMQSKRPQPRSPQNAADDPGADSPDKGNAETQTTQQAENRRQDQARQDSTNSVKNGATTPDIGGAARQRLMVKEVWGHLPAAMQRRLMNASDEKTLPKYERLVEKYFSAIAEKATRKRGSGR